MRKVNGRQTPSDGKSSHCLWQGELKNETDERSIGFNYIKNVLCVVDVTVLITIVLGEVSSLLYG